MMRIGKKNINNWHVIAYALLWMGFYVLFIFLGMRSIYFYDLKERLGYCALGIVAATIGTFGVWFRMDFFLWRR